MQQQYKIKQKCCNWLNRPLVRQQATLSWSIHAESQSCWGYYIACHYLRQQGRSVATTVEHGQGQFHSPAKSDRRHKHPVFACASQHSEMHAHYPTCKATRRRERRQWEACVDCCWCTVSMTHSYIQNLVWHLQIISCSLPTGSTTHMLGRSSSCSRTPSTRSPPRAPLPHRLAVCSCISSPRVYHASSHSLALIVVDIWA